MTTVNPLTALEANKKLMGGGIAALEAMEAKASEKTKVPTFPVDVEESADCYTIRVPKNIDPKHLKISSTGNSLVAIGRTPQSLDMQVTTTRADGKPRSLTVAPFNLVLSLKV